jgi:hypothetical protein
VFADVPASVILPILGGLIGVAASWPAVRTVWLGGYRPSWVSRAVWTATTGLGAATTLAAGEPVAAVVPAAAFVCCAVLLVVTVRSIARFPTGRAATTPLEWTCLGLAAVSAAVWQLTGSPLLGLVAAIVTDALASGPTWPLAWARRESFTLWAGAAASPALTLLVLRGEGLAVWAYPVYELTLCASMAALTGLPRWALWVGAAPLAGAGIGAGFAYAPALTGAALLAVALVAGALVARRTRPAPATLPALPWITEGCACSPPCPAPAHPRTDHA